jgi:hypothetical protein
MAGLREGGLALTYSLFEGLSTPCFVACYAVALFG